MRLARKTCQFQQLYLLFVFSKMKTTHPAVLFWLLIGSLTVVHCTRNDLDNQPDESPRYWRWSYPKKSKVDSLNLPRTIPDDEKWMKSFDVPRLHLILDSYSKTVRKIWWLGKLGRTFQTRILRSILNKQIKHHSNSVKSETLSNEVEPRIENFWNLLPCFSSQTEPGLCLSTAICSAVGGVASGSCMMGSKTCCVINKILTTCSANVIANNTYWQSPMNGINSDSICMMKLHLNTGVIHQNFRSICQVRIDFDIFSIAQPATDSICSTDVFRVTGSVNNVPPICGDNSRQHMYLTSTSTARNLQLIFSLGSAPTVDRAWRLKISLLPCYVDYLAPPDCLQYITTSAGTVKSFNWKDIAPNVNAPRQLAEQDYRICFRPEMVTNNQVSTTICLAACPTKNGGLAFSLSRKSDDLNSSAGGTGVAANCPSDFILFLGGFDNLGNFNDRFCGNRLNPVAAQTESTTVCSNLKPYHVRYVTNKEENNDGSNNGFCLNYVQF